MSEPAAGSAGGSSMRRALPLVVLVVALGLVLAFDLHHYLSFETLKEHRQELLRLVGERPALSAGLLVVTYAVVTALSVPGAAIMTLAAGFLFGTWIGGLLAVLGATIGAVAIFLVAKTSLGDPLRDKAGPWLRRMEDGFAENALSYLLFLRLVPVFPFWLVNLVPAFLGVPLGVYTVATFVGIIPGGLVYASVGNGLGAVFEQGGEPDLGIILQPEIILPILALALLSLVPVAHGYVKKKRHG